MNKTIGQMLAEVREVNTALGWRAEPKTLGDFIALLHSEIAEALEAYRDHRLADATDTVREEIWTDTNPPVLHGWKLPKPEGVGSEFADFLIRLLDTADVQGYVLDQTLLDFELADIAPLTGPVFFHTPMTLVTFGDFMAALHRQVDRFWDTGDVARLLRVLVTVAEKFGVDLTFEYERKIAYNRTRPYQHGGRTLAEATP